MISEPDGRKDGGPAARIVLGVYRLLLRAMPEDFRRRHAAECLADARTLIRVAARRSEGATAVAGVKIGWDVMRRLPAEWWAALRWTRASTGTGRNSRHGLREGMMHWMGELRQAARTLAKKPGFTAVSVVTLALGIGANLAIFAIVNGVLLGPLPFEESDRVVEIRHHAPGLGFDELGNSPGTLAFWRENGDFYESMAHFQRGEANLTGSDEAARVQTLGTAPEIFDVLRVQPLLGRPLNEEDVAEGPPAVALLAHDVWRSRFGGDPAIVGSTIRLDDRPVEVIGVMPPGFFFPDEDTELYVPRYVDPDGAFGTFGLGVVARLGPGVRLEVAQERSDDVLGRISDFFPSLQAEFIEQAGFSVTVRTLRDRMVADVETILWILLGTVVFVLLIACANVANLFMVRAESRQKEMAVRTAMGAGRRRVAASFLGESLILGVGGGVVGVLLAQASIPLLLSLGELPREARVSVDLPVLALAGILSVGVGLIFGLLPVARYSGGRSADVLRDGHRGSTTGRERHRTRNLLVATQLALALILLVGSGLMLRSFAELRAVDLGVEPDGVLVLGLNRISDEDPRVGADFFRRAADRIATLPGVASVGITTSVPLGGGNNNGGSFYIESQPREEDRLPPTAMYRAVDASYFESMGMTLLAGRPMERVDWEEARPVVWVNESFARTHLGDDALGERIAWNTGDDGSEEETRWAEVVGVVEDVREFGLADEDMRPNAYFPLVQGGGAEIDLETAFLTVKMREDRSPTSVVSAARSEIRSLDASVPVSTTRTMADIVSAEMEGVSATMIILAVATGMALFLGAIGLAGVISYVIGQRTREIGVRVALGATASDVRDMILRQSMTVSVLGVLVGLAGAFGLTRLLDALLFHVSPTDPLTFSMAPVVLVGISLLASWLPVHRATRIDPMEALRSE